MSGATQRTARRHIPEDDTLHNHRCENLKSYRTFRDFREGNISIKSVVLFMFYGHLNPALMTGTVFPQVSGFLVQLNQRDPASENYYGMRTFFNTSKICITKSV
jgi:hypothetical protein